MKTDAIASYERRIIELSLIVGNVGIKIKDFE